MRVLLSLIAVAVAAVSCGGSSAPEIPATPEVIADVGSTSEVGPGGFGFDRSDREGGIANIMAAFATDEATATCIFDAWGDVANVPAEELTPELFAYEVCGTSIFQLMTGDPRFTGGGE